jgi:hypothetical protein
LKKRFLESILIKALAGTSDGRQTHTFGQGLLLKYREKNYFQKRAASRYAFWWSVMFTQKLSTRHSFPRASCPDHKIATV